MRYAGAISCNQAWLGLLPAEDAPSAVRAQREQHPAQRHGKRGEGVWDIWTASILTNWRARQRKIALKEEWQALRSTEERERWMGTLEELSGALLQTGAGYSEVAYPRRYLAVDDTVQCIVYFKSSATSNRCVERSERLTK
jgi:hypothetical protein